MYKKHKSHQVYGEAKSVERLSDGASIPFDIDNSDYQAYLKWLSEGNEPESEFTEEELEQKELQTKLNEAQAYLTKTDYKMLNNYVPKEDEDLQAVIAQRNTYIEFIMENS